MLLHSGFYKVAYCIHHDTESEIDNKSIIKHNKNCIKTNIQKPLPSARVTLITSVAVKFAYSKPNISFILKIIWEATDA